VNPETEASGTPNRYERWNVKKMLWVGVGYILGVLSAFAAFIYFESSHTAYIVKRPVV
jgi:hypothetical protein